MIFTYIFELPNLYDLPAWQTEKQLVMLKQQNYILNSHEDYNQIISVRELIEDIHDSGTFFHLSLKTLELIRRFNNFYIQVFERDENSPSNFNQLMILSRNLETELIREH